VTGGGAASTQAARRRRRAHLASLVGLALAQWTTLSARADSGVAVDTAQANAMNPAGLNSARFKDPDGLGLTLNPRSPTGFLYPDPWALPPANKTDSGWELNASIEVGALRVSGDRDAAKFREYKDLKSGLYVNNFALRAEKPADANFLDVYGGGIGRNDQYFSLSTGHYNAWKLKAFYTETPHVFTSTYRSLWNGVGSGNLTLKPGIGLTAGPPAPATVLGTEAAVRAAVDATPDSSLSLVRKKGGVRLDALISDHWKAFAGYTNEHREGARPFGMIFGGGGGAGSMEIPESIDYHTHDLFAGVQWGNTRSQVNLQALGSFFRNHVPAQNIDNAWFVAVPVGVTGIASFPQGQFALYPDNDAYSVKVEAAHAMPEFLRSRVTALLQTTSTRQNDALLPMVVQPGLLVNGLDGKWNTPASLSKPTADARIDSRLADLGLALAPVDGLDLRAKLRHYETRNDTEYWACNPLTGQWGRLINNGSSAVTANPAVTAQNPGATVNSWNVAACNMAAVKALKLAPAAGNINIRNIPYEYTQDNTSASGDWRLTMRQNLSLALERETFKRKHRERDETWEDKIKLGYVNRELIGGTLRASLETARRRGSTYNSDPYEEFYSGSMGPLPTVGAVNTWIHTNDLHRKFDLADRDTQVLNLRFNHPLSDELDFGMALQLKDSKYPSSAFGRKGHWRQNSVNADINWQPAPELSVYGFASRQAGSILQAGDQAGACTLGTTYYFRSDGSVGVGPAGAALTPAQLAAGITTVATSEVKAENWQALCAATADNNPLYATGRVWNVQQDDRNTTFGAGVKWDLGRVLLDLNYAFSMGRTRFSYAFNPAGLGTVTSGAATPTQLGVLGLIGDGLPDQVIRTQSFDASVLVPVGKLSSWRLIVRHETGRYRDPHYDGVAENRVPYATANPGAFLDTGAQDFSATAFGVMYQLNW
jgi:hypothetical protein